MAPSFDCSVSISNLLCAEDKCIFDNNDDDETVIDEFLVSSPCYFRNNQTQNRNRNRSGLPVFGESCPLLTDECLIEMVEKENQHLPSNGYLERLLNGELDFGARKEAVDWIQMVSAHFNFGPLCTYLAVNYLDRFLSSYELPKGKAWTMQLLAVACTSLAAKLDEHDIPLCLDLQVGGSNFVFEARTIERMELLVLTTLRWRMQAITPLSFMDYYLHKILDDEISRNVSLVRSIQLVLNTIQCIDFLEFRPSEIAAAVAISVVGEETQSVDPERAILVLNQQVKMERVLKCIKLINDMSLIRGARKDSTASIREPPRSPSGVLDVACLSYKSSNETTVGSCANSSHNKSDAKRRRLNRPCEVEL